MLSIAQRRSELEPDPNQKSGLHCEKQAPGIPLLRLKRCLSNTASDTVWVHSVEFLLFFFSQATLFAHIILFVGPALSQSPSRGPESPFAVSAFSNVD